MQTFSEQKIKIFEPIDTGFRKQSQEKYNAGSSNITHRKNEERKSTYNYFKGSTLLENKKYPEVTMPSRIRYIMIDTKNEIPANLDFQVKLEETKKLMVDLQKIGVEFLNKPVIETYLSKKSQIHSYIYNACLDIINRTNVETKIFLDFEEDPTFGFVNMIVRQKDYQDDLLDILFDIGYKYIDLTKELDGKFRIISDYRSF